MLKKYKNGNVSVSIDLDNGTKERFTNDDEFNPEFAESMDVTITYKCDGGCSFCYAGCTTFGKHANLLSDYVTKTFIPSLHPYTELALNGNNLSHPQLKQFLTLLKERNVIANMTVNQRHFMQNISLLHEWTYEGLIHGLGVSLYDSSDEDFLCRVKEFPNAVIHVIAGIVTPEDINRLSDQGLKVLILGYKHKGRGKEYYFKDESRVNKNIAILQNILPSLINLGKMEVICFDNLALEQLGVKDMLSEKDWEEFYMGDDGTFTFFVDLVNHEFALSSTSEELYDIDGRDAKEMFDFVRKNP